MNLPAHSAKPAMAPVAAAVFRRHRQSAAQPHLDITDRTFACLPYA